MPVDQASTTPKKETAPCAQTHGAAKQSYPSRENTMIDQAVARVLMHRRWLLGLSLALVSATAMGLTHPTHLTHNAFVPFNSGTEIGVSNKKADSRQHAAFFTSVISTTGAPSMAGRGGRAARLAGSFLPVRQSRHVPATPDWRRGAGLTLKKEATMPSIALRAFRSVFPLSTRTVSTLPTLAEARALAALLVSMNKRVVIQSAAQGFTVAEVAA